MKSPILMNVKFLLVIFCALVLNHANAQISSFDNQKKAKSIQKKILKAYEKMLQSTVDIGVPETGASGVLISEDGYILTAAHVIAALEGKDSEIRLNDGTKVTATCLGKNTNADYGLLKIKEKGKWVYADLGSSSDLVMNEACVMLGHPEVYDPDRPAVARIGFYKGITSHGYLKTSCIMMPGDSGGPLFDLKGRVIGICSYIKDGINENYYPAIDKVKENWERLEYAETFYDERQPDEASFINASIESSPDVFKGGKEGLKSMFQEGSKEIGESVVKIESIIDGNKLEVYGTLIDSKGYIISKSSRVGDEKLKCQLNSGVSLIAKVIGRDESNDLVIIQVESNEVLKPIALNKNVNTQVGQLLGTVGQGKQVLYAGMLSVKPREVLNKDRAYFGVEFASSKPIIGEVFDGGAAEVAGLVAGDEILKFDKKDVENRQIFYSIQKTKRPGQKVVLTVLRNGEENQIEVTLGKAPIKPSEWKENHPAFDTEESKRKDDFPNVFTHDMSLMLDECGTPVIDLDGQVIGINIARKNRVSAFAIPIADVLASVENILDKH
ncbi:MAG: trypsin-like peptidase domain-containing protein [Reichenbachiella sp.]|uniref:S1C family serine protease n=1 Tax=Reichenbachiella sp. TaxID=2184521 RepID=UPI003266FE12